VSYSALSAAAVVGQDLRGLGGATVVHEAAAMAELSAPTGLTAQASTFDRRDVVRALCQQLGPRAGSWRRQRRIPSADADEALGRLRWLLEQLADGIALTQTGDLHRAFVRRRDPIRLDIGSPPRGEHDLFDLSQLRQVAQRLRLTRRSGSTLRLTRTGEAMRGDAAALWRAVALVLLKRRDPFVAAVGELALALLVTAGPMPSEKIRSAIGLAVAEMGFRDRRTDETPGDRTISWALNDTLNRCRPLVVPHRSEGPGADTAGLDLDRVGTGQCSRRRPRLQPVGEGT